VQALVRDRSVNEVSFTVYGVAAPGGSKRAFRHSKTGRIMVTDASKRVKPWREVVGFAARDAMTFHSELGEGTSGYLPPLEGPLILTVDFYLPRPKSHYGVRSLKPSAPLFPIVRPDATKLLRVVEDACTGILWRDDAQIAEQHVRKHYGEPARCEIHVDSLLLEEVAA
jgi:hypothetical protein